jgi:hypothetical protein
MANSFSSSGVGGTPYLSPDSVSGLSLWLKSDTAVFSDAGTTPVVADGTVRQWNDQGTLGANVVQATSGKRPVYKTNIVNGFPAIRFTGSNSTALKSATYSSSIGDPFTICLVYNVRTLNGPTFIDGATVFETEIDNPGTNAIRMGNLATSATTTSSAVQESAWAILTCKFKTGSGNCAVRKNGTSLAMGAHNLSATTMTALTLGSRGNDSTFGDIDYAEVIIYNRELSDGEMYSVERYLGSKYAITVA